MKIPAVIQVINRLLIMALGLVGVVHLQGCSVSPSKAENTSVSQSLKPILSPPLLHVANEDPKLHTAYDYILLNSQTQQPLSVSQLATELKDTDVIFIGEFHGNHASHLLQSQLQTLLYQQRPNQILSMEQFNRDQQGILNQYLDHEVGEAHLINEAPAWENYAGSYRPLVEFAKQHFLPVIAANAPADTVRCIGRQGEVYLEKLTEEEANLIAQQPLVDVEGYRDFFMDFLNGSSHFDEAKANNSYLAQLSRDNTMAESILNALNANTGAQVIHTNGAFHSNNGLGTVGALKRLNPKLKIKIISPVHVDAEQPMQFSPEDYEKGDYLSLLQPQPEKYLKASNRQLAFKRMFKNADAKLCR